MKCARVPCSPSLPVALLAASTLVGSSARAEPLPLRIDYQASAGCPDAGVFLDEIRWRTALAHVAETVGPALSVQARIVRQGDVHRGQLTLGEGRDRVVRAIQGAVCDEVVSALALITALAIDPGASTAPKRPASTPSAGATPTPSAVPVPPEPAIVPPSREAPPEILAEPLPVVPSIIAPPSPPSRPWLGGVVATAAFAATIRPLLGGGAFVERGFADHWSSSVRLTVELAATGASDAGQGRVSFLRGLGRLTGCSFTWSPVHRVALAPCLAVEGGVLQGKGVAGGTLTSLDDATVPWAAASVLARVSVDLGPVVLDVEAGPAFPLIRRTFVFRNPSFVVSTVPPVTALAGLGGGVRFP